MMQMMILSGAIVQSATFIQYCAISELTMDNNNLYETLFASD